MATPEDGPETWVPDLVERYMIFALVYEVLAAYVSDKQLMRKFQLESSHYLRRSQEIAVAGCAEKGIDLVIHPYGLESTDTVH